MPFHNTTIVEVRSKRVSSVSCAGGKFVLIKPTTGAMARKKSVVQVALESPKPTKRNGSIGGSGRFRERRASGLENPG